jgi:uncharacterized protein (DUF362 family)
MTPHSLSRRQFLKVLGAASLGFTAAGCQPAPEPTSTPQPAQRLTNTPIPTLTPYPTDTPAPTETVAPPNEITATTTASVPWNPLATVSIGQQSNYDRAQVRARLEQMLDDLGGLKDIVAPGARVALKVNLTGGIFAHQLGGVPAVESIATHPEVVRALGELLIDAGAKEIFIVEAVYQWESYVDWGYEAIAKSLNATLIDLNDIKPYPSFTTLPVGPGALVYPEFTVNPILAEVDTFISVAKMKCHIECGVTHAMKNLVGMVPYRMYRTNSTDGARSAFHEDSKTRLPRIVVDLNMARPIHLAIVDGIKTIEAGEGSWAAGARQIAPGLLFAGKNALATDSVATLAMGFDPVARYPNPPFSRADNYLNIAYNLGLGTNLPEEIEVLGPSIEEIRLPFAPASGYR